MIIARQHGGFISYFNLTLSLLRGCVDDLCIVGGDYDGIHNYI